MSRGGVVRVQVGDGSLGDRLVIAGFVKKGSNVRFASTIRQRYVGSSGSV